MANKMYSPTLNMQRFGTDCQDLIIVIHSPEAWHIFSRKLKEIVPQKKRFQNFRIGTFLEQKILGRTHYLSLLDLFIWCYVSLVILFRFGY